VESGILDAGAQIIELGVTGSEEVYSAGLHFGTDVGIEVAASHNPMDYNDMKFIGRDATPISSDGLGAIKSLTRTEAAATVCGIRQIGGQNA
jgi:phosphomannomutase